MFKYKPILSFCSLLLCSLLFLNFGSVRASAASDNLIDSDLRNWDKLDTNTTVNWTKGYYQIGIPVEKLTDTSWCIGAIYDLSELNAGYSYKLNFYTVTPSEMGLSDSRIYNQLNFGSINIGLGSYDSSTNSVFMVDDCFIAITKDNYSKYFGYDTSFTFTLPNVENPCIVIYYAGSGNTVSTYFGFKNFSLIDTEAEKEQNFLERLFAWFERRFDAITENFEILGVAITNIPNSIIEGIKSLFIPPNDFLVDFEKDMKKYLTEHLGIIFQSADTFSTLFTSVYDLLDGSEPAGNFVFPDIKFDLNFGREENFQSYNIDLYSGQDSVDLSFLNDVNSFWYEFYHYYYKAILYIILSAALLLYAYNVCDKLFR